MDRVKIALTCSGLSHVRRGVETWSELAFQALRQRGVPVTLFKGSGDSGVPDVRVIRCVRRGSRLSRAIGRLAPPFSWRLGFGSAYQLEQTTFAIGSFASLARGYDLIHTKDPQVALMMQTARRAGLSRAKVILNHGTEEPPEFLGRFDYVQHLAPFHREDAIQSGVQSRGQFVVPNFVETDIFSPGPKGSLRQWLGIPMEALVVLCVAAIRKQHKRLDWLFQEIDSAVRRESAGRPIHLVVAGSKTEETNSLIALGKKMLGERVHFLVDAPHEQMPNFYRSADLFVLCSLKEMLANACLEALASGLPVLMHREPVAEWAIGDGGCTTDMTVPGALAAVIGRFQDPALQRQVSERARQRALSAFARDTVIEQQLAMYREVLGR